MGVPTLERGAEQKVAHKWGTWLHNPCRLGGLHRFRDGGRIIGGSQVGRRLHNHCRGGGPHRFKAGGRITGGSQVGRVAT